MQTQANVLGTSSASEASEDLHHLLTNVSNMVPPLWPLQDYVAVNPFLGLCDKSFLDATSFIARLRDCELLPSHDYFESQVTLNNITREDVLASLKRISHDYPDYHKNQSEKELETERDSICQQYQESSATSVSAYGTSTNRCYFTASEVIDKRFSSSWTSHIINDITRHCAAHYDLGQANWANPWKDHSLYQGWRDAASRSLRLDLLGIRGFRSLVAQLPAEPVQTIPMLLRKLSIPQQHWQSFLICQLFSVYGWASFIKYRVREVESQGATNDDLIALMAMRLTYDLALAQQHQVHPEELCRMGNTSSPVMNHDVWRRYVMLSAAEIAYQRKLCSSIDAHCPDANAATFNHSSRKSLQMVFCIDVRSEILRRNLESINDSIETFGFAGFFGLAFAYTRLGETHGRAQCPVLLNPAFHVHEEITGVSEDEKADIIQQRTWQRYARKFWKSFQTSAASCFSFVESVGVFYAGRLLTDSLMITSPVSTAEHDGLSKSNASLLRPELSRTGKNGLSLTRQIDLAEGMLRILGLTDGFAPLVAICGHEADVVNNPYRSGLACGACGGHSGDINARVAAMLLNDPEVRKGLADRSVSIPDDTWFLAAVHRTTSDTIEFFDVDLIPTALINLFQEIQSWLDQACNLSRIERSLRIRGADSSDLIRRSRDWAEVRPEWGLAGNAAFIVAPRSRTSGLTLQGRTFMHSYDYRRDPGFKTLELIMTAPMIVTNWINLQYYASTVDNQAFGSGNKLIHNIVGQFGVLEGNGGDLKTGFPWQSLHDGRNYQHQPQRLLVVIEAPRHAVSDILRKHPSVANLVQNDWIILIVRDDKKWYRWSRSGAWQCEVQNPFHHPAHEKTPLLSKPNTEKGNCYDHAYQEYPKS